MTGLVLVGLIGGVGAGTRWLVEELAVRWLPRQRSWATTAVNIVAALLVGVASRGVVSWPQGLIPEPSQYASAAYLTVGFCGGFSTFSSALAVPVLEWRSHRVRTLAILLGTPLACALSFWAGLSF